MGVRIFLAIVLVLVGVNSGWAQPANPPTDSTDGHNTGLKLKTLTAHQQVLIGDNYSQSLSFRMFEEVLRIVGVKDVSNGTGTIRPLVIDVDGDVKKDTNTTLSTAGVWTFGLNAGAGRINLNGAAASLKGIWFQDAGVDVGAIAVQNSHTYADLPGTFYLRAPGGTPTRLEVEADGDTTIYGSTTMRGAMGIAALGVDHVRCGTNTGTARCIWEDAGSGRLWEIDNLAGVLRFIGTDDTGVATAGVPLQLSELIEVDPVGKGILPRLSYDINLGSPIRKFLTVNAAELNVETLVAQNTMATIGGRILVAPTTYLIEDLTSAATTIKVKHNNLANGDRIYLEGDGRVEFMAVTSGNTLINICAQTNGCSADALTNWASGTSTLSQSFGVRYQGNAAVAVSAATNGDVYHTAGTLANSTQYTLSIYIRRADGAAVVPGTGSGAAYRMYCRDAVAVDATADDVGDGWYRLHATCTTGTTGTDVMGVLGLPNLIHYVDAAQVELGATMTAWSLTASSYTVTRDLDGSSINFWESGAAIVNTGQTGNGFIDIYSTRGVRAGTEIGPTIVGNVRLSSTYNDWAPRWAVGNLNGLYGYGTDTFGFAAGDASAAWLAFDSTNGLRGMYGTTKKFGIDMSGVASFTEGAITIDDDGISIFNSTNAWANIRSYRFTGNVAYSALQPGMFYLESGGNGGLVVTAGERSSGSDSVAVAGDEVYLTATTGVGSIDIVGTGNLNFGALTVTVDTNSTATSNLSCSAGQAIKAINVYKGWVRSVSCGAP